MKKYCIAAIYRTRKRLTRISKPLRRNKRCTIFHVSIQQHEIRLIKPVIGSTQVRLLRMLDEITANWIDCLRPTN